ncbi:MULTISPECIES: glycosyltransferase family 4 protein [Clostridium]|uniref:Alpha-D-kanosaminyltransferase n=2 Tax=Clostridium TaxID=1485 RepID=A0A151AK28_9CLOT|nr:MULTISPECIES: glycosyltransferase family 4 protein [Clostridium]KYH28018.1 alpha-D-kanosaminyltransferase [Clostridium colicanis DSM 13634]PRR76513.1 Alpha-D-kanosaminyltransferase [Clostridium thermopalmarium DSM 5974]PVZ28374.1 glycosyltransferase involved in cell wall biosynthesis [Clostridium thermopalmarium DSM 5974]
MKKIKVLHITQATIGGTLEYIKLFFNNTDKSKFQVELACPSYGPMKKQVEELGIKVHDVYMKRQISLISDLRACLQLIKLVKKIKPDIIHIHSSKAGVLGRIAAYVTGVPCIYNAHGWSFSMNISNKKKKFYATIERICAKLTKKIINISDYEQQLAIQYNIAPKSKMITIYNGIDVDKYNGKFDKNTILSELNIPKDAFIVGMVGRLAKQKSPETFLKIAERISMLVKNSFFILVGDGELRKDVEKSIVEKGLTNKVKITGWTNEVAEYISVFDIGILTSKWEGFGLVLAEYMASGKPIVASNVGGIPTVIENNRNGILVDSNDIDGFVDGILKIKNNKELRDSFITNSYKDVREKFDIRRVVREHEELYIKIIKNSTELLQ